MRNMQTTFDLSSFEKMNAPTYSSYSISSTSLPKGETLFGRTFYAFIDGKIYGLKILAWAIADCGRSKAYLIQTPSFTRWTNLSDIPLFTSVNDLVEGKNKFMIPLVWTSDVFTDNPTSLRLVRIGNCDWAIMQSFYYSKSAGRVKADYTKVEYIVGTPQGIFFGLVQKKDCYKTKDECLSATFNGMDIVDFAEPTIVEIKIEIPSTEVVTRKLVLE